MRVDALPRRCVQGAELVAVAAAAVIDAVTAPIAAWWMVQPCAVPQQLPPVVVPVQELVPAAVVGLVPTPPHGVEEAHHGAVAAAIPWDAVLSRHLHGPFLAAVAAAAVGNVDFVAVVVAETVVPEGAKDHQLASVA